MVETDFLWIISCLSLALSSEGAECKTHGHQCENSIDLSGLRFSSERYENRYWEFGFLELRAALSLFDRAQWDQHTESSFPQPSCCHPHSCSILSTQPVWHGVTAMIVTRTCDLGNGSQAYTVGDYRSNSLFRCCGSGWEVSCSAGSSPCLPLSPLPCSISAITAGFIHLSPWRT